MRLRARNYAGYCNPEVDKLIDQQSMKPIRDKRKQIVWEIERKLAEAAIPAGASSTRPARPAGSPGSRG